MAPRPQAMDSLCYDGLWALSSSQGTFFLPIYYTIWWKPEFGSTPYKFFFGDKKLNPQINILKNYTTWFNFGQIIKSLFEEFKINLAAKLSNDIKPKYFDLTWFIHC